MGEKIKIGEKEYQLPFKRYKSTVRNEIHSSDKRIICNVHQEGFGEFIADALNAYAGSGWKTNGLPINEGRYLVTVHYSGGIYTEVAPYSDGRWFIANANHFPDRKVIAWRPLPEPYKAD